MDVYVQNQTDINKIWHSKHIKEYIDTTIWNVEHIEEYVAI